MLNRRLLRIKAMQTIYAFEQSRDSNRAIAEEWIKEQFLDELRILGAMEKKRLAEEERQTVAYYWEHIDKPFADRPDHANPKVAKVGQEAIERYHKHVSTDFINFRKRMVTETEQLFVRYVRMLKEIVALADYTKTWEEEKVYRVNKADKERLLTNLLYDNKAIAVLREHEELNQEATLSGIKPDTDTVHEWYKLLRAENELWENLPTTPRDLEADTNIVVVVARDFLFKHEAVLSGFEDNDINWTENKQIIRSMVLKTIKSIGKENDETPALLTISRDWEDDKDFFVSIYKDTIENEPFYGPMVSEKSLKWAKERIAKIDRILMHMAISEMINFRSIPVKVTINEYIEISKSYSTPKSWQFINGILDNISKELEESGKIRKSGRGLIDNK